MKHRRTVVALIGFVVAVSSVALATSTIGAADGPPHPAETPTFTYMEPSPQSLPDGAYFGYIRALGNHTSAVAVDFVSLRGGVVGNAQPEQRVNAGVLGEVGYFDDVARPFRIKLHNGTIVAVQSADDTVEGAHVREAVSGSVADVPTPGASR